MPPIAFPAYVPPVRPVRRPGGLRARAGVAFLTLLAAAPAVRADRQAVNDAHGETRAASAAPAAPLVTDAQTLIDWSGLAPRGATSLADLQPTSASLSLAEIGGQTKLEVRTTTESEYPGFTLAAASFGAEEGWDLRGRRQIAVEVENLGDTLLQLALRVDMPGADDDPKRRTYFVKDIAPGATETLAVDLANTAFVLDPPLDLVGMRAAPGQSPIDLSNIVKLVPFGLRPTGPTHYRLGNVEATGRLEIKDSAGFKPFIDRYGQFVHADWPGKATADADLAADREAEAADLAAYPGPDNRSRFGGWAAGPKLEATGHFRTAKHDGKWYLVDPEGHLFWSHGVDCLHWGYSETGTDGREDYFAWLPDPDDADDPLHEATGESSWAPHGFYADKLPFATYSFYTANLIRKYGEHWIDHFARVAHERLKSWGLNTVASWGHPAVYGQQTTPYTAFVWVTNTPKIAGNSGYWGQFHDVFDPRFREEVARSIRETDAATSGVDEATDPWNIGYYVDNEIQWGDDTQLAVDILTSPAEQAAKIAFLDDLKQHHRDIAALNAAWGTAHDSWDALLNHQGGPPDLDRARPDLLPFNRKLYDVYFRTIKEELRKHAPDKLYLGARFAWVNDDVARASATWCDVVSYNKYEFTVKDFRLPAGVDRPVIIGEFHFGSNDRGLFHPSLKKVPDQAARGDAYAAYVGGALDNPQIVGTGWFQYTDQAATGRSDGENFNAGMVSVTDRPHEGLIDGIRRVGYTLYERRAGQAAAPATPDENPE